MKKILLFCAVFFLSAIYTDAQVVQYEYKDEAGGGRNFYAVLQIDYTKERFVYRAHDTRVASRWRTGYVEMYGVLKKDCLSPDKYITEIYDWLYMEFTDEYSILFKYYPMTPKLEHIEEGNPLLFFLPKKPADTIELLSASSLFSEKYPKFYSSVAYFGVPQLIRSKRVRIDKKLFCKELYRYVVKEREDLIYREEEFSPHADFFTRIYRNGLFPTIRCE